MALSSSTSVNTHSMVSLPTFSEGRDDFQLYLEQLECYFEANNIPEEKHVPVFLAAIGSSTYKLLRNLLQPAVPRTQKYADLASVLKNHFKPQPNVIAERYKFYERRQNSGESIQEFMIELKRLASTCAFESHHEFALRDKLVCGLRDPSIQRRLFSVSDLTLQSALEIAIAMELADRDLHHMRTTSSANAFKIHRSSTHVQTPGTSKDKSFKNLRSGSKISCHRCGGPHLAPECKFIKAKCHSCGIVGHLSSVCRRKTFEHSSKPSKFQKSKFVNVSTCNTEGTVEVKDLYSIIEGDVDDQSKYQVIVHADGIPLRMLVDTAADVSTIGQVWVANNLPRVKVNHSDIKLRTYTGTLVPLVGEIEVSVTYHDQTLKLPLVVVSGNKPPLLGRNWLNKFKFEWSEIFCIHDKPSKLNSNGALQELLLEYDDIFLPSATPIVGCQANIQLKDDVKPVYCKYRQVPYSLKDAVEKKIRSNIELGIWEPVECSQWATPLVCVAKKSGDVRLCGDFKCTVNPGLDVAQYPLPVIQDIFATLSGGCYFSTLDCSEAYHQVELTEASREVLTLNTHLGLVRPKRLEFGIASAAAIFQRTMDTVIQGLPCTNAFQDDILTSGDTVDSHLANLRKVFERLRRHNVKLNKDKCKFLLPKITYLGHVIDKDGLHPTADKIEIIKQAKAPSNVTELRSFLGIVNYYGRFFENMSTVLAPLHNLLCKEVPWNWSQSCQEAFNKCKRFLMSDTLLVHYDPQKPIKLFCDASSVGVGVVLSHVMQNGMDRPIAFASRSLTKSERHYSQIEREALAIIFGVRKFQQYLIGRHFTLVTDHQPLLAIFGPKKGVPVLSAERLRRWAIQLATFNYDIQFKRGVEHLNADGLSRPPMVSNQVFIVESDIYKLSCVDDLPVTSKEVALATRTDPVLGRVMSYIQTGWPMAALADEFTPFHSRRDQLSVDSGCVVWGLRVIIPKKLRESLLTTLHESHLGMSKMKAVARGYFWWPGLDSEIESLVRSCEPCQLHQADPPKSPAQPWTWPSVPWSRLHIDYALILGQNCLIIYDSHSRWIEVIRVTSTTSISTIEELRKLFSQFGLPVEVVSDNGPQFTSNEFSKFMSSNGVRHVLIPAYHPATNGPAERSVRLIKEALAPMGCGRADLSAFQCALSRVLFMHRTTPHTVTGLSPSEMFLGRVVRTRLSLLRPGSIKSSDKHIGEYTNSSRSFSVGQSVWVRNHASGPKWIRGVVSSVQSSRTYLVTVGSHVRVVHVDQLRGASSPKASTIDVHNDDDVDWEQNPVYAAPLPVVENVDVPPVIEDKNLPPVIENIDLPPVIGNVSPPPVVENVPPLVEKENPVGPVLDRTGLPELGRPRRQIKPVKRLICE